MIVQKKVPDIIFLFCQGRIYYIRGATLIHDLTRALSEIPAYLRQFTHALRRRILCKIHLTAPSAVHLTICFVPGSQHPGFSVGASLPLSPLQRFNLLNLKKEYHTKKSKSTIFLNIYDNICGNASCDRY